jgi:hypothetical protein
VPFEEEGDDIQRHRRKILNRIEPPCSCPVVQGTELARRPVYKHIGCVDIAVAQRDRHIRQCIWHQRLQQVVQPPRILSSNCSACHQLVESGPRINVG